MLTSRFRLVLGVALLVSVAASYAPLTAQSSMLVVASGLDNPRGLSFGPDGALYVAESGRGGTSPLCLPTPEPPFPVIRCLGPTGAITRVSGLNVQRRVVTGLPSVAVAPGNVAAGPQDVEFGFGSMWITIGLSTNPAARTAFEASGVRMGWLARASMNGDWSYQLDLAGYEATSNPDGGLVDSNPFKLLLQSDRALFVDAGGNVLNQIDTNLAISTLAVFPRKPVPGGGGTTMDSVPTSVAATPDGTLYVGELTGVPFPAGAAAVYRLPATGGTPVEVATGFSMIIDLAAAPDGSVYVLEHDIDGLLAPGSDGRLTHVRPDGTRTVIASAGLTRPGGVAIGPDGALFVTRNSSAAGIGDVVRISAP
jgi:hypothetical protein